jgi:hypothetical protein
MTALCGNEAKNNTGAIPHWYNYDIILRSLVWLINKIVSFNQFYFFSFLFEYEFGGGERENITTKEKVFIIYCSY